MNPTLLVIALLTLVMPHPVTAQQSNEATEPAIAGPGVIDLLAGGTMDAWQPHGAHLAQTCITNLVKAVRDFFQPFVPDLGTIENRRFAR